MLFINKNVHYSTVFEVLPNVEAVDAIDLEGKPKQSALVKGGFKNWMTKLFVIISGYLSKTWASWMISIRLKKIKKCFVEFYDTFFKKKYRH